LGQTNDGSGTGSFTSNLTGLNPATIYYVRAYATSSAGTSYGNEISFTTAPPSLGTEITNSIGMVFRFIPAGTFQMGSATGDRDEQPVHSVTISKGFYMGKFEVTQNEWVAVMSTNPSFFKGGNLPVEQVSWHDVETFIAILNAREGTTKYRLPTEAEWEYAARAGTTTTWSFGNDESQLGNYAWYNVNSGSKTNIVGQKLPNPWGLYDMHGNVWEWVQDWYSDSYYSSSPTLDPQGPTSGSYRVGRGGGWVDIATGARAANRLGLNPGTRYSDFGFRLVRME
jgi:formylglycine-generating enzyme required for sulfatase activity